MTACHSLLDEPHNARQSTKPDENQRLLGTQLQDQCTSVGELKPRRDVRNPPKKEKNHEKSKESKHECLATYSRGGANTNFACPKEALINSSENWLHTLP